MQGVNEAEGDKFKLFYKIIKDGETPEGEMKKGWEKEQDVMSLRYVVNVRGLPQEYKQNYEKVKVSDVKSV